MIDAALLERDAIAAQTLAGKARLEQLQADYDLLEKKRQQVNEDIVLREQFAANVEEKVAETIQRAQDDAATFIANMASAAWDISFLCVWKI